jgi:hypothetical protein
VKNLLQLVLIVVLCVCSTSFAQNDNYDKDSFAREALEEARRAREEARQAREESRRYREQQADQRRQENHEQSVRQLREDNQRMMDESWRRP